MTSPFNASAYSVRLFMPHGDPDGLRIIDQPNWSGTGIAFPRGSYKELSKRKEFERTGVYLLLGPGPDGSVMPTLTSVKATGFRRAWILTTRARTFGSGLCSS